MAKAYMYPDADDGTNQMELSTGSDHYALIDDDQASPDDDTTYLFADNGGNQREDIQMAPTSIPVGSTINSVKGIFRYRVEDAGDSGTFLYGIIHDSNYFDSTSSHSVSYTDVEYDATSDESWQISDFTTDGEIKIIVRASGFVNPEVLRYTQGYVEIDYTAPASGALTSPQII